MEIIGNQKKYSKNNIKNEKLKFLHNAVENYNSELHIKHILAKKKEMKSFLCHTILLF